MRHFFIVQRWSRYQKVLIADLSNVVPDDFYFSHNRNRPDDYTGFLFL